MMTTVIPETTVKSTEDAPITDQSTFPGTTETAKWTVTEKKVVPVVADEETTTTPIFEMK